MTRTDIINTLIKAHKFKSYLEIGVANGDNFEAIQCQYKVGVDPGSEYSKITHNVVSDEFFTNNKEKFDIVFIDGRHEENQVIKDIENALRVLNFGGIVVCHDMSPDIDNIPEQGSGNCWRGWIRLKAARCDVSMYVVDTDCGCGIIDPAGVQSPITIPKDFTWDDFSRNRKDWLDLISLESFKKSYV